jgi:hypothetical protein
MELGGARHRDVQRRRAWFAGSCTRNPESARRRPRALLERSVDRLNTPEVVPLARPLIVAWDSPLVELCWITGEKLDAGLTCQL